MEGSMMGRSMISTAGGGVLDSDPCLHHATAVPHPPPMPLQSFLGLAPLSTTQHLHLGRGGNQSFSYDDGKGTSKVGLTSYKGKSAGISDDDEPSFAEDVDSALKDKGRKCSPWQRVKWTDAMVKLLINVVFSVGEDGCFDCTADGGNKSKSGSMLQKKGKWKTVSQLMNEKRCYVSPQQCEDKFNDLNKRYKRLNEILGKGTACDVVENPNLLETMDNLCAKAKDDVRKILSSKHLFYREMCSYHRGCKPLVAPDLEFQPSMQDGPILRNNMDRLEVAEPSKHEDDMVDYNDDDGDDDDDNDDDDDAGADDMDDNYVDHNGQNVRHSEGDSQAHLSKRRKVMSCNPECLFGSLSEYCKALGMESLTTADGTKSSQDPQSLVKARALQLEEYKVSILAQLYELEKQRYKWRQTTDKSYQKLEQLRQENKKMKLENEQMSLQLKQKELEVECKRSETPMTSIELILDRLKNKGAY